MRKSGRNDPCPCGSGKKYKRCCLDRDRSGPATTREERASALSRLTQFAEERLGLEEDVAYEEFYGRWEDRVDELDDDWTQLSDAAFDMWFLFDYRMDAGGRVVDLFLAGDPPLGAGERAYLEQLRGTAMRLYEIVDLSPGASVDLRDVLTGTRVQVHERLGSRSFTRHMHVAARVVDRGPSGQSEIESGLLQIPELIRPSVVSQLADQCADHHRERPEAEEVEFFEEMAPFFHEVWMTCLFEPPVPDLKNTDGDDLLLTRMRFDVIDRAGLEGALDRSADLERDDDGRAVWHWSSGPNP